MKQFCLLLLVCCLGTAFAAGNIENGKKLSLACGACHGMNGVSSNAMYPNLAGQRSKYIFKQLMSFKKGKDGGRVNALMNATAAGLSEQDMHDLAVYYASLPAGHGKANPKYVKRGRELFLGGDRAQKIPACAACHGPRGDGNNEAGFPAVGGQHAAYVLAQLEAYRDGKRPGGIMMRDITKHMSKEDMEAVASYIQGLH